MKADCDPQPRETKGGNDLIGGECGAGRINNGFNELITKCVLKGVHPDICGCEYW